MQDMQVLAIGLDTQRGTPLLLVAEQAGRHRALPLSIGVAEAVAIQLALRGIKPPRPPTHQLIVEVITALGTQLDHVEITALRDNIFHADLVFADDLRISARPSDAVALALQARPTDPRHRRTARPRRDHSIHTRPNRRRPGRSRDRPVPPELDKIDPDDFTRDEVATSSDVPTSPKTIMKKPPESSRPVREDSSSRSVSTSRNGFPGKVPATAGAPPSPSSTRSAAR